MTAIVVACAVGAGVTGALLWRENRSTVPTKTTPTTVSSAVQASNIEQSGELGSALAQSNSQAPPSNLTAGMSPAEAALTLGNWHYDHEQWDSAVENYQSAIKGGIDNPNIRTDLGNSLRFSDRPQEGLKQYQLAQKQDPTHEESLFNQGALYAVSLKNPRKGVEVWKAYLKRFPTGKSAKQARELLAKFAHASK